jgi:exosortase B
MPTHSITSAFDGIRRDEWWVALGFSFMFLPVYWRASQGIWQTEEYGHAPLVLLIAGWLAWRELSQFKQTPVTDGVRGAWVLLALGLLLYVLGRVLDAASLEFTAHLGVLLSLVVLLRGWAFARTLWFPLLYLVFFIPAPATVVDLVTSPLKLEISSVVTSILSTAGLPIARSGVVISIGQYQLLVADACSGVNSMLSLFALGTLYMYLMHRPSKAHNLLMFLSIVPIAFAANIVRVITLVLVTYFLGDEAGQGFLHGAAGVLVLLVAVLLFSFLDAALLRLMSSSEKKPREPSVAP